MKETAGRGLYQAELSERDFERLSRAIQASSGIRLPRTKKILLEGRLRKRLRELGMSCFEEYCAGLFNERGNEAEFQRVIDLVTTNKTDFFREARHFDLLTQKLVPELSAAGLGSPPVFRTWSAGCSSGEEAYTIAMVLSEYARANPGFDFMILATDICTDVLRRAHLGIYRREDVEEVPPPLRQRYVLKSRDRSSNQVRIVPELRRRARFRRHNLLDGRLDWPDLFHVVFCRNVIIYFDRKTQERILLGLCRQLKPGGYLLMGHSETLNGFDLPLRNAGATVYTKL